jgi:hypothetical protein
MIIRRAGREFGSKDFTRNAVLVAVLFTKVGLRCGLVPEGNRFVRIDAHHQAGNVTVDPDKPVSDARGNDDRVVSVSHPG